jgi:hypothetical protein
MSGIETPVRGGGVLALSAGTDKCRDSGRQATGDSVDGVLGAAAGANPGVKGGPRVTLAASSGLESSSHGLNTGDLAVKKEATSLLLGISSKLPVGGVALKASKPGGYILLAETGTYPPGFK